MHLRDLRLSNWRLPFWRRLNPPRKYLVKNAFWQVDQEKLGRDVRADLSVEWLTTCQLVHLATHEGIGKGGVTANQGLWK